MNTSLSNQIEDAIWTPNPGSQYHFITCPFEECLIHGTRGSAKTDGLLWCFASKVGMYGEAWRGIIFRQTYKQLEDIVRKSKKWFHRVFPKARFNESDYYWHFPDGERLYFSYMRVADDYANYHGHEYAFIGWEELTSWPTDECYTLMMSCLRSSDLPKDQVRMVRATTNPWGVGHAWVKERFIDVTEQGKPFDQIYAHPESKETLVIRRTHLFSSFMENPHLIDVDPGYIAFLKGIKDPELRKAWLLGSWDIVAGGYFSAIFKRDTHVVPNFTPPKSWQWFPSFDWGSESPHSLGLWCISNGEAITLDNGISKIFPANSKIRFDEWYGTSQPGSDKGLKLTNHQLAEGIAARIDSWTNKIGRKPSMGVADPSIWKEEGGPSIHSQMSAAIGGRKFWWKADNTRIAGWQAMVDELVGADHGPRLYVAERCRDWIRTISLVPRDMKNPDDVDTESEDHAMDETRYAVMRKEKKVEMKKLTGF